ncbi:SURF1 family protein [Polynucleobacter sp. IMCC30063]|uniref:SURF1 family protein n=1 Tax=Polynucleobacter sp. IMCC30063 TaxID=2907298 RepID=UPI001F460456|nr:SURF1 family protein [Polynucleobacter sp. IMCC30063]MCE7504713.1 SURF1 family protein [Polynucleobacter sp. IMCC30063]
MNIFERLVKRRIVATVAMLFVVTLACALGAWQMQRAAQKTQLALNLQLQEQLPVLDASAKHWTLAEANHRRMRALGRFLPDQAIWLDNRPRPNGGQAANGQSGFYLLMPMRLEGVQQNIVWINRGWVPRNAVERTQLPPVQTPSNLVEIEGTVFPYADRVLDLAAQSEAAAALPKDQVRIQQNLDLTAIQAEQQWNQLPFILRQAEQAQNDGLVRNWAPQAAGVERHYAYAFQWFALGLCAFLFWLIHGLMQQRQISQMNKGSSER